MADETAPLTLPALEPRQPRDRLVGWRASMMTVPGGVFAFGVFAGDAAPPGNTTPACVTNGKDADGAAWIAGRLARAAQLENYIEGMLISLATALAGQPEGAVPARELYLRLYQLLTFGGLVAAVDGAGATEEGMG